MRDFIGRTEELRRITRYSLYPVMFYRSDLLIHSARVWWIIRELNPFAAEAFGGRYDPRRAELLALVHDDAEIIMGDIQAGNKSKMTKQQLEEVASLEEEATRQISRRFPKTIAGYNYQQLLKEAYTHASLEAQVLQYADKFDGLGEALHELYAGNQSWTVNVVNQYGRIPLPTDYYRVYFERFLDKYPDMKPMLALDCPWFRQIKVVDAKTIASIHSLHTADSIRQPSGCQPYDLWRETHFKYASSQEMDRLYIQVEHPA